MIGWKHWCPNGCGKKVVCTVRCKIISQLNYQCEKCKEEFTRKEIKGY